MRRAWLELVLLVATGAAHLVFENLLDWKGPFFAAAGLFWTVYLAIRLRTPGQAAEWGFRRDTLRPAVLANAAFLAAGALGMIAYGVFAGRSAPSTGFFYLLGLYPVWGLVQQFLLCGLLGRNLLRVSASPLLAVAVSSLLFGLAHAPDWPLCGLTAGAGGVWLSIYMLRPNLWANGICHGWLGALAYVMVLGRDPWRELTEGLSRLLG